MAKKYAMHHEAREIADRLVPEHHPHGVFYLADHDLEESRDIVARHGFWKPDVRLFAETMQRSLFEETVPAG
jgi:hypothetical protein